MTEYQYKLEKYSGKNSRYTCPSCSKKNQFTRYISIDTNEWINEKIGICNRIEKCGYHYTPKKYFEDNDIQPFSPRRNVVLNPSINKVRSYIPLSIVQKSLKGYQENNFTNYLIGLFGSDIAYRLIEAYKIGSSKYWLGATVFWQIDAQSNTRSGKVMLYNSSTGKRVKEPFSHINWVHSILNIEGFGLDQCLFGEHLITETNKIIAVVESEKTAIICSAYFPEYVWVATGALYNLKYEKFKSIKNRHIILYPDTSVRGVAYQKWQKVATELKNRGYNCVVNDLLENNATQEEKQHGVDLADYLIKYPVTDFLTESRSKIHSKEDKLLNTIIDGNSAIKKLTDKFDLGLEPT